MASHRPSFSTMQNTNTTGTRYMKNNSKTITYILSDWLPVYRVLSILKYTNNQRDKEIFQSLFYVFWVTFSPGSQAVSTSKPRCRQQRNIGSMNIHAVVLPSMPQLHLVQQKDNKKCLTTCWTNFFSLSFFDHRSQAPKILFPWSMIHQRKVHDATVCRWTSICFESFMNQEFKGLSEWANPNTLVCLYLYIDCFVRSNLRISVLMSEPSSYADGLYHGNKAAGTSISL